MTPPPSRWTYLLLCLNAATDRGMALPMEEAQKHLDAETIIDHLEKRLGKEADFSLWDASTRREMNATLRDIYSANAGSRVQRKFGVEKTGLALVTAMAIEAIQQERTAR